MVHSTHAGCFAREITVRYGPSRIICGGWPPTPLHISNDGSQVIEIDVDDTGPPRLEYDEEWLGVMRATHGLVNLGRRHRPLPGMGALRSGASAADLEAARAAIAARGELGAAIDPGSFVKTAAPYSATGNGGGGGHPGFKVPQKRGRWDCDS